MAKTLKDILAGVKSSRMMKAELGKDPGVDYKPKSKDEADFAASHSIEKHDDRVGNDEGVFTAKTKYALADKKEKRHGHKKGEDEKVNESHEEEAHCNMSEAGVNCPVHGKKKCASKEITEDGDAPMPPARPKYGNGSSAPTPPARPKPTENKPEAPAGLSTTSDKKKATLPGSNTGMRTFESYELQEDKLQKHFDDWMSSEDAPRDDDSGDDNAVHSKAKSYLSGTNVPSKMHDRVAAKLAKKFHGESYEHVNEVLTKKDPAGKWISDFVKSDNPKFAGKSKKERTKQALAAYYAKQRNEAVEPLLGSADEDELNDKKKD